MVVRAFAEVESAGAFDPLAEPALIAACAAASLAAGTRYGEQLT